MEKLPKSADRVRVPFGGRIVGGEVLSVSELGGGRVFVRVELNGPERPEETMNCMYRVASVELATAAGASSG